MWHGQICRLVSAEVTLSRLQSEIQVVLFLLKSLVFLYLSEVEFDDYMCTNNKWLPNSQQATEY
jgi:hypothetical protein